MPDTAKEESMRLDELLNHVARRPTTEDLWMLRGALLDSAEEQPDAQLVHEIAREFFLYVSELQGKVTARAYNVLASRLDIGAVGMLALQGILQEQESLMKNLLLGGIGEGFMVVASRQYIKAWEQELRSLHRQVAWTLYGVLWSMSTQYQHNMTANERRALIETTLAPALDDDTPIETKTLLVLRLFQSVLLLAAAPLCAQQ